MGAVQNIPYQQPPSQYMQQPPSQYMGGAYPIYGQPMMN